MSLELSFELFYPTYIDTISIIYTLKLKMFIGYNIYINLQWLFAIYPIFILHLISTCLRLMVKTKKKYLSMSIVYNISRVMRVENYFDDDSI